jgi:hypothetical protein
MKREIQNTNEMDKLMLNLDKQHKSMLTEVQKNLPQVEKLSSNFGKTQSQFMDNMLTTSHPTPIRNVRQMLAEINKSLDALKEAYYKNEKEKVYIKKLQRDLKSEKDELEKELIEIKIEEKLTKLETGKKYIAGAIRKIHNYQTQYNSILKTLGVKSFDEIDFEKEEEEYHIKKAFEQGLNAARSNGGRIDEGNQIYLTQLGINGTLAQKNVVGYLMWEENELKEGREITAEDQWRFLDDMYHKFKGSAKKYAAKKGMSLTTETALLTNTKQKK